MISPKLLTSLTSLVLLAATCDGASAQTITRPAASVTIAHNGTNADQVFPQQNWSVTNSSNDGATVTFSTNQAFTNTADNSYRRDARLNLAVVASQGAANWTATMPTGQTDYEAGNGVAVVQARSIKQGSGTLALTVTFLTVQYETLAEGTYQLTVTGTITAN